MEVKSDERVKDEQRKFQEMMVRFLFKVTCCFILRMKISSYVLKTSSLCLTLLHSERPKLYTISAFLSAIGLNCFSIMGYI